MISAQTRLKPSVLAYGMLLAVCGTVVTAYNDNWQGTKFTQDWVSVPGIGDAQGVKLWVQPGESWAPKDGQGKPMIPFEASMVKVTLPPCTLRTMHIHRNVDEIHYIVDGTFTASLHIPDASNTIVTDTITAGQSFLAPANYVHELINPSCDKEATFIGFYNQHDAAITNIAPGAYKLADSPFMAYQDPSKAASMEAASSGFFAFDATCLAKCNKSPPCGYTPPYTYTPPTTTYTPPTTTYSPPTETYSPPTYTYSPPTEKYSPPTTAYSPPTKTYSPPTYTYSPPTTTYSPPTKTYSPPTYTYSPPTTTYSPPTEKYSPPTTTYSPPTKTYSPPTTYTPPTTTYTPPTTTYTPPITTYTPPAKAPAPWRRALA